MEWLAEHLKEAEFWVGAALLVFTAVMIWAKVPGMAGKALDARAEKIRAELLEAERLRKEAEALLASIKVQREDSERIAAEMIRNAEEDAKRLESDARVRLEEQIQRRSDLARAVLAGRLAGVKSDPLVDRAVKDMAGKFG